MNKFLFRAETRNTDTGNFSFFHFWANPENAEKVAKKEAAEISKDLVVINISGSIPFCRDYFKLVH